MAVKKLYEVLVVLALAIIIILFVYFFLPQSTTQYVCQDGRTVRDKTLCVAEAPGTATTAATGTSAVGGTTFESELSVCTGMPSTQSGSYEDMCIIGLAGKHKDTSLCSEVIRDQRLSCYALVAEVQNNPDVCAQAEFQEDQCYEQYARDKRDGSACAKIKTVSNKDNCYSNLASQLGDPTFCDSIVYAEQKNRCYFDMAQRSRDSSYCDKITSSDLKQNCLQNIQSQGGAMMPIEAIKHP